MHRVPSLLISQVVSLHTSGLHQKLAQEDEDHKRYLLLEDILDLEDSQKGIVQNKTAQQYKIADKSDEDAEISEKAKQKRLKGDKGVLKAYGRLFRDLLEQYMPDGYFFFNDYAKNLSDEFYKIAYKFFKDRIPMTLAKVVKPKMSGISTGDIDVSPEGINQIINDAAIYFFSDSPEDTKDILVRSFSKRERQDEEKQGLGTAQVWFTPRINEETFAEMKKDADKIGEEVKVKVGDVDTEVLKNLSNRKDVEWKWGGIDENGILSLTFPKLYGGRQFKVKLPSDIENIRPGTYTFDIKRVGKRGAVLDFAEQKKDIHKNTLSQIKKSGLSKDQLINLMYRMLERYNTTLQSTPPEKLVEKFLGNITIRDKEIGSVEDLAELGGGHEGVKQTRSEEEINKKRVEKEEEIRGMSQAILRRWGPTISKYFLSITDNEGREIVEAISSKYPEKSEKSVPSLLSILRTKPVVKVVLETILNPTTPLGGSKSSPWITIAIEKIKKVAIQDPNLKSSIVSLMSDLQKKKKIPAELTGSSNDITVFLNSIGESAWRKNFTFTRDSIKDTMLQMKDSPALKKFFDRRKQFKKYVSKDLNDSVKQYIVESRIDPSDSKGRKLIDTFIKGKIDSAVSRMTRKFASKIDTSLIVDYAMAKMFII